MAAVNRDVEYEIDCARDFGVGLEIQSFALPEWLDKLGAALARMRAALDGVGGTIGLHGPFLDTCHYSLDRRVQEASRRRYLESLTIADQIGASFVVFHSQYNMQIKLSDYPDIYHAESVAFWPEIIEEAARRNITLYMENMFEPSPEPLVRLMKELSHPRFRIVFDVAHSALYSDVPIETWVEAYAPYLSYVHLNDCNLVYDDHLGLGEGKLDLARALTLIEAACPTVRYGLETNTSTAASLEYLGIRKLR